MPFSHSNIHTPAIVLGLTANGLGILRCLGKEGIRCYGIYQSKNEETGCFSKYLITAIQIPKSYEDQILLHALFQLREKAHHPQPVLFPTSDAFVFFIARNKNTLQNNFLFHDNDINILTLLNDKSRTTELSKLGLPIPHSLLSTHENIALYVKTAKFPSIIKPTTEVADVFPDKVYSAKNKEELISFFQKSPHLFGKCIIQEEIPGGDSITWEVCTFSAPNRNLVITCTLHKIRQYPPDYGISSFIQTEENQRLKKIVENALEAIQYTGCADWEFLYCEKTDKYYLIDINCRTGMPNQICADSGMNIVACAYRNLTEKGKSSTYLQPEEFIQRNNVFYLNLELDIGSFFRKWKLGELTLIAWLKSLSKARSFAFFSFHDPLPWFAICRKLYLLFFKKTINSLKHKFF